MYFDRLDIIQAHYWYCTDYHTGMGSELYETVSTSWRILKRGITIW